MYILLYGEHSIFKNNQIISTKSWILLIKHCQPHKYVHNMEVFWTQYSYYLYLVIHLLSVLLLFPFFSSCLYDDF